jgi:nucleotidyltransferase substrate binding protein (TIGR01987 family)
MTSSQKLDYSSLEKAIHTLNEAIVTYNARKEFVSASESTLMRDGIIQRFEYTFELSWKTMKRYLEMYGIEQVDKLKNRDFFRSCYEAGLIRDPLVWFDFLQDRNQTSHTYDQVVAVDVYDSAVKFIADVQFLLAQLQERIT